MLRDPAAVLARGRAMAAGRRTSLATVRRKTGDTTVVNRIAVPVWTRVHVDVPSRLAGSPRGAAATRTLSVGGNEIQAAVRVAHFAHDLNDLADGDLIEYTAGENSGLVLMVVEATAQDQATERRIPVVAVPRPKEWS